MVAEVSKANPESWSKVNGAPNVTHIDLANSKLESIESTYDSLVRTLLNQSQGEMHIRRIPSNRGRTDFNVRAVELYLAAATRPHHPRNVDPTLALV